MIMEYAAVALSGCIFTLLAASWISPIFRYAYGYDSSWYSMMGRAITEGKVPYRDYYDVKGPILFFIEAIGQLFIKGRNGVFLIECAANSFSAVFIWRTAKLYLRKWQCICVLFLFYFVYVSPFWGGNTVEEYMLPFNFACIFLGLRYMKEEHYDNIAMPSVIFGFSFALMALAKMTVAAPMVSVTLAVLIELIRKKKSGLIPRCIGYFLAGAAFIVIPVCAYFAFNHAFSDFIFCSFTFAFQRSTDYYEKFSVDWEQQLFICYVAFIFGITMHAKRTGHYYKKITMIVMAVVTYLLLHLGTPYTYYFITLMPLWVYFLIEAFETADHFAEEGAKLRRIIWTAIGAALIVAMYAGATYNKVLENINLCRYPNSSYYDGCREINTLIPSFEKDQVYDLESGMIYYEINQLLPTNKYPVNLPYFLHLNPPIKTAVLQYLDNVRPKWIISENMSGFDDQDVKDYVFGHYELISHSASEELYRRVD